MLKFNEIFGLIGLEPPLLFLCRKLNFTARTLLDSCVFPSDGKHNGDAA